MYSHNFLSSLNHLQKVTKNEISDSMKKTFQEKEHQLFSFPFTKGQKYLSFHLFSVIWSPLIKKGIFERRNKK